MPAGGIQVNPATGIDTQKFNLEEVHRFVRNFKKDSKSRYCKEYFEAKVEALQSKWKACEKVHFDVVQSKSHNAALLKDYLTEYDEVEQLFEEHLVLFRQQIRGYTVDCAKPVPQGSIAEGIIPLERIKVPRFNGDFTNWASFHDLYKGMVHDNQGLSAVQKMQYLKASVTGEAEKIIKHLSTTEANYPIAWSLLEKRFNNPRATANALMRLLWSIKSSGAPSVDAIKNMLNITNEVLSSMKSLNVEPVNIMLVYFLQQKLDAESNMEWQKFVGISTNVPTIDQFLQFLSQQLTVFEALQPKVFKNNSKISVLSATSKPQVLCQFCKGEHKIYKCEKFQSADIVVKRNFVKRARLCFNCLSDQHSASNCTSSSRCKSCKGKHYSALHSDVKWEVSRESDTAQTQHSTSLSLTSLDGKGFTLLATARVWIKNSVGTYVPLRALIDQGSQDSFITESAAQSLGIARRRDKLRIYGINKSPVTTKGSITVTCREKWPQRSLTLHLHVLPNIASRLPQCGFDDLVVGLNKDSLADNSYNIPDKIDMLLGADIYSVILKKGLRRFRNGQMIAQKTSLGWIVSGTTHVVKGGIHGVCMINLQELDETIKRFWEQEEVDSSQNVSEVEAACAQHYTMTTRRQEESGRYIVRLPFKTDVNPSVELQSSMKDAIIRLRQMENRLDRDEELKEQYNEFLKEYLRLGHMEEIPKDEIYSKASYYLPHHAVTKASSSTTKVRVVFDASHKTSSGKSLNDLLMIGPTIQDTIFELLLRWRTHKFVITGDIEKMYRQVLVDERDRDYQRIVWRPVSPGPIKHYRLKTITYGTASAPYQAIRTLTQLAKDEQFKYPAAAQILQKDFYVDDVLSGASDIVSARKLLNDLKAMLEAGGMKIRKWASNNDQVLDNVASEDRAEAGPINIDLEQSLKTLGLLWQPKGDFFVFKVDPPVLRPQGTTKRLVASAIARLYDPLGWLQPTVIIGKVILQKLWLEKIDWDDCLPNSLLNEWSQFINDCPALEYIKIPRHLGTTPSDKVEIHGFCDASMVAYAAVVYLRVIPVVGNVSVSLITAKAKVAPLKSQSIPRLELNAAVLLSKLITSIKRALKMDKDVPIYCWTDSTIVLAWLRDIPARWKTYVANRVSEIHSHTNASCWRHVGTDYNPADCASRGMLPSKLIQHSLWWKGPSWLSEKTVDYASNVTTEETDLERRHMKVFAAIAYEPENILERFSSFTRLTRVVAYCLRMKSRKCHASYLTTEELKQAIATCAKLSQRVTYKDEIEKLESNKHISAKSKLLILNPFLDAQGVLRVGGRLQNAPIEDAQKHPIIISPECNLAKLIVKHFHERTLHGGQQLVMATVRREFWIPQVQKVVKSCIHKCLKCFKTNAQPQQQLMGNLPEARVTPARAFSNCGLDFAGPITIKWSSGRGAKTAKSYIALFICLTTKAIHLEIVSDLTTSACIAAIKRFVARRGLCSNIYSDCGTNFVGANKELKDQFNKARLQTQAFLANEQIKWHFNPPSSPHFGGLWEAGVKSVKLHLIKTIGSNLLNIEELYTVLTQIEAVLNSRPLVPMSNDINDEEVLTPGHFLIGQPLVAVPQAKPPENSNLLRKWHLTTQLVERFWARWSTEYLSRLQQRPKWMKPKENLAPGQLVLVKNENYPPTKWPLARILQVHPGNDGIVRVATIKLRGLITKRPVVKLSPLPIPACESNNELCSDVPTTEQTIEAPNADLIYEGVKDNGVKDNVTNDNVTRSGVSQGGRRGLPKSYAGLLMFMIIGCIIPITEALVKESSANIAHVNSGLIVEHLGHAYLNKGTLQLRVKIPWEDLRKDSRNIIDVIKNMTFLCDSGLSITQEIHCSDLLNHLVAIEKEIQHKLYTIHFVKDRQKRGILGSMLTAVFGINDEVYRDIDNLEYNQQSIRRSLSEQTKLMLRATHMLNQTNDKMENRLVQFNERLNTATNLITQYTKWYKTTDHNKINLQFFGTYQRALNFLNEVLAKYTTIVTHIYTKEGILDLIQPAELIDIINKTEQVLPPTFKLSHVSFEKLTIQYEEEALLIDGYLPIIDQRRYDLIKATAVPHRLYNRTYTVQDLSADIIGVNFDQQVYFELNEEQFREQIKLPANDFLIRLNTLYDVKNKPNCIIREVFNMFRGQNCSLVTFEIEPSTNVIWKRLFSSGKWLFIALTQTVAHQICGGKREEIILTDTGILSLPLGCELVTDEYILSNEMQVQKIAHQIMIKSIPIEGLAAPTNIPQLNITSIMKPSDTFSSLIDDAQALKNSFDSTIYKQVKTHHFHLVLVCISSVIIICIIILLIFRYKSSSPPTARWYDPEPNQADSSV